MTLLLSVVGNAAAQSIGCGTLSNAYGPYDYSNAEHRVKYLPIVEVAHFNSDVESLTRGQSSINPMDDIHYTLRAFPNHTRALDAMSRYFLQNRPQRPSFLTAECYFERALIFKPDDGKVYLMHGTYLHRRKKLPEAARQYQRAQSLLPDSADVYYNYGLLRTDLKEWTQARQLAVLAYAAGHPLQGLKRRLQRNGHWGEAQEREVRAQRAAWQAPAERAAETPASAPPVAGPTPATR